MPTTIDYSEYSRELTSVDRDRLSEAAGPLDEWGSAIVAPSVIRYGFYRYRGYDKAAALSYALAYLKNVNEQYARCLGHDTGAEGWRPIR